MNHIVSITDNSNRTLTEMVAHTVKEKTAPPFELVQYTAGPLLISLFHNIL